MTDFDVCLSSTAMKNIVIGKIQEGFEFFVGGRKHGCPCLLSEFLSPRICLSHSVDPSISEYVVQNRYSNDEFQLFMSLGSGSTIRVTKANLELFLCLSREFGNSDLYISLLEHFDNDFLCSQIHDLTTLDLLSDDLIGRISSNFYVLAWSQLDEIPVSVHLYFLSHNLLKISSEDDLFSYISSRICSDPEYLELLQFIRFEYLSAECIYCFLSDLPDSIDRRLWESISPCLISAKSLKAVEFPLRNANPLDGIISYLTRKHGGNVHDKGIVTITSQSVYEDNPKYATRSVADLASDSYFWSKDEPGQWVCWDFHEMRVHPTRYTIRSDELITWVIESSLDGEGWTEIDRKTDNNDFEDMYGMGSFAVSNSAECRFIRLTQTGVDAAGFDDLLISAFELFGTLLE
jgi:hypothetical protein